MIITFLIVFIIVFVIKLKYETNLRNFWTKIEFGKTIPGPGIIEFFKNTKRDRILAWMKECRLKYGPVFKIWLGKDLMLYFTDPDDVQTILSSNTLLHKSPNYDLIKPWLQKGLLINSGADWHKKRKLLTPAFHFKILGTFKEPIKDNCDILVKKLEPMADGNQIVDIYSYVTLFALDVICETAMGIKKHAQLEAESEYVQATKDVCRLFHKQFYSTWQRIPFLYNLTAASKERQRALQIIHGETRRVIQLRRSMLNEINLHKIDDIDKEEHVGEKRRFAFLDILLLTQKEMGQLTDQNIQEEVDTFMFEGHDTTSSAISFVIYLLSQHPHIQQKVYNEVILCIGKEAEPMKYLEAVIKETLRLYPSVPFYSRITKEPFKIGNITLPPNTSISIFSYMVHRNPDIYPNPEDFIPERYLTDEQLHPYSNVAFSAGPRNCIGQRFAILELKCTVAKLLRAFEILPVIGFKPILMPELILKSDNGIQVRLKMRENRVM